VGALKASRAGGNLEADICHHAVVGAVRALSANTATTSRLFSRPRRFSAAV